MKSLKQRFEDVCSEYIERFEKKHGYEFNFWVGSEVGGIACFCDQYYFNLSDITYDINNKCKKNEIFEWQDYQLDETNEGINFHAYHKGLRVKKVKSKR